MVFSSLFFYFIFLPLFLVLYYVIPKPAKNYVLLIFSLVFYAWGEPVYVLLMLGMTLSDFLLGLLMQRFDSSPAKRKVCLILSIVIDLSCLAFFKYATFLVGSFNSIFKLSIPFKEIALPIGISFFTFQTMSYTIDLYRREISVEKNYAEYLMYVSMFPQLIAGPIVRYIDIEKQLVNRVITSDKIASGIRRFLYGVGKKVVIANTLAVSGDQLFDLLPHQFLDVRHLSSLLFRSSRAGPRRWPASSSRPGRSAPSPCRSPRPPRCPRQTCGGAPGLRRRAPVRRKPPSWWPP